MEQIYSEVHAIWILVDTANVKYHTVVIDMHELDQIVPKFSSSQVASLQKYVINKPKRMR